MNSSPPPGSSGDALTIDITPILDQRIPTTPIPASAAVPELGIREILEIPETPDKYLDELGDSTPITGDDLVGDHVEHRALNKSFAERPSRLRGTTKFETGSDELQDEPMEGDMLTVKPMNSETRSSVGEFNFAEQQVMLRLSDRVAPEPIQTEVENAQMKDAHLTDLVHNQGQILHHTLDRSSESYVTRTLKAPSSTTTSAELSISPRVVIGSPATSHSSPKQHDPAVGIDGKTILVPTEMATSKLQPLNPASDPLESRRDPISLARDPVEPVYDHQDVSKSGTVVLTAEQKRLTALKSKHIASQQNLLDLQTKRATLLRYFTTALSPHILKSIPSASQRKPVAYLPSTLAHTVPARPTVTAEDDEKLMAEAKKVIKDHIQRLHTYNEIRDVGQGLIGMIADQRGLRIVECQEEFGVGIGD